MSPSPALSLLAALLLGQTVWAAVRGGQTELDLQVMNGLTLGIQLLAVLVAWQVWHRERWTAYALMALAFVGQFGGDLYLVGLEWLHLSYPESSVADISYFAYYAFMLAALLRSLLPQLPTRRQAGRALDGLIIAGTVSTLLWERLLSGLVSHIHGTFSLINLSYVMLDILLLGLSLTLLQVRRQDRANVLLSSGLFCLLVADIVYLEQAELYRSGGWLDVLWSWGIGLQAAAVWSYAQPAADAPPRAHRPHSADTALQALPYAAVLLVCWLLAFTLPTDSARSQGLVWGAVVVVTLATLRQWLTATENRDITRELRQRRAELEHLAFHDHLTGLYNRAAFNQFLQGTGQVDAYAIFSLDLDGFKAINDTHGHAAGDQLLRHVAQQLGQVVAAPGRVFRWGGDEFVIVVPGMDQPAQAEQLIHELHWSLMAPLHFEGHLLTVGTSIGYALGRGPQNFEMLLSLADSGMYRVKQRSSSSNRR